MNLPNWNGLLVCQFKDSSFSKRYFINSLELTKCHFNDPVICYLQASYTPKFPKN